MKESLREIAPHPSSGLRETPDDTFSQGKAVAAAGRGFLPLKEEVSQCAHRDGEVLAFLVTGLHMTIEKTKKSAARNVRRLISSLILSMMGHCVSLV